MWADALAGDPCILTASVDQAKTESRHTTRRNQDMTMSYNLSRWIFSSLYCKYQGFDQRMSKRGVAWRRFTSNSAGSPLAERNTSAWPRQPAVAQCIRRSGCDGCGASLAVVRDIPQRFCERQRSWFSWLRKKRCQAQTGEKKLLWRCADTWNLGCYVGSLHTPFSLLYSIL